MGFRQREMLGTIAVDAAVIALTRRMAMWRSGNAVQEPIQEPAEKMRSKEVDVQFVPTMIIDMVNFNWVCRLDMERSGVSRRR